MKPYKRVLFIFRRDLRITDNTGLNWATQHAQEIIPCFIFDPRQVEKENKYRSIPAIEFMIESLTDLQQQLSKHSAQLSLFYGIAHKVVEELLKDKTNKIEGVIVNRDYTPFSIERDNAVEKVCKAHKILFQSCEDILLHNPDQITNKSGKPYFIFTPFFKRTVGLEAPPVSHTTPHNFYSKTLKNTPTLPALQKVIPTTTCTDKYTNGGRKNGLTILAHLEQFKNYATERNFPALNKTTFLSAHLKFGTISIREAYWAICNQLGKNHPLIRELFWREFMIHTAAHAPQMFGSALKEKYNNLPWNNDKKLFERWCSGNTGFPIVDAGMRQLNQTGFMHNRVRMITASFLIKDLHINWLWGERYFAQKLVDYDPAVNNANWQWCASTGFDAQPYFRIFNPWLQQKKFDAECEYIKEWVPELRSLATRVIHNWYKEYHKYPELYCSPIVDHTKEAKIAKLMYKKR